MGDLIERLLSETFAVIAARRGHPSATYRLQFHAGFTFQNAMAQVKYLHQLGISHCYASPYLQARPGSQHGYDITNHRALNSEIGSAQDYAAWVAALGEHDMGHILDTVPNHMGVIGNENAWWNDVLENGPSSPFAGYFDIAWNASPRPELQNKVLLPILGNLYGETLESQQLQLAYAEGAFTVNYFEHRFPVTPSSYDKILGFRLKELEELLGPDALPLIEFHSILTAIKNLPPHTATEPAQVAERRREKEVIKRRLATLTQDSLPVRDYLERTVGLLNGQAGNLSSFDPLDELLNQQPYRLSFWRVASDEINYRRFFDVNDLAALNMEREDVFLATHELVLQFLEEGTLLGLRIDHPDGLYDPKRYLQRLQQQYLLGQARAIRNARPEFEQLNGAEAENLLRERIDEHLKTGEFSPAEPWPLYVVVEKILNVAESLPADWPTFGTSGYDFLNMLNGLFVAHDNAAAFTSLYQDWIQDDTSYSGLVHNKKYLILQVALASELHVLAQLLDRLAQKHRRTRDFTLNSLRHALRDFISCFPVYRSYISGAVVQEADRTYIHQAFRRARARNPVTSPSLFQFVRDMLLQNYPENATEADKAEQQHFAGKFQQVTAPVMAKGVEDTVCYVYNRLLSLNDVGGDPSQFGILPSQLHRYFQDRQAHWPWALSTTSTHDTKRSEDVRARLNVLSELPEEWRDALQRWSRLNQGQRTQIEQDQLAPDANEEYFLYQSLLGAWPLKPYSPQEFAVFVQRMQDYMVKALHEAKIHSSWINPDAAYDDALRQFIARILDPISNNAFIKDFVVFQNKISHFGLLNSLSQTLVKITAPGIPDIYQGNEVWDFSLVDPDNRRPVDYKRRQEMLQSLIDSAAVVGGNLPALMRELVANKEDGRIKMWVTYKSLQCRRRHPELFTVGEYVSLQGTECAVEHGFSFGRQRGNVYAVIAVPRLLTGLVTNDKLPVGDALWQNAALLLPETWPRERQWHNVFTGEIFSAGKAAALPLSRLFGHLPFALYLSEG